MSRYLNSTLDITVPAPIEPRFYGTIGVFNCKSISILTNVSAIIKLLTRSVQLRQILFQIFSENIKTSFLIHFRQRLQRSWYLDWNVARVKREHNALSREQNISSWVEIRRGKVKWFNFKYNICDLVIHAVWNIFVEAKLKYCDVYNYSFLKTKSNYGACMEKFNPVLNWCPGYGALIFRMVKWLIMYNDIRITIVWWLHHPREEFISVKSVVRRLTLSTTVLFFRVHKNRTLHSYSKAGKIVVLFNDH